MITIIDTRASNLQSVRNAFAKVGADTRIANGAQDLDGAAGIVLPGVGAFQRAMDVLEGDGYAEALRRRRSVENSPPLLGICLGMQLLADASDEHGHHRGLGLIPGKIVELQPKAAACRVPNIGWYPVQTQAQSRLFENGTVAPTFYFVHSFHFRTDSPDHVSATIDYCGEDIAVAVERGHTFGVQFHPEKSQSDGLNLIEAFVRHVGEGAAGAAD